MSHTASLPLVTATLTALTLATPQAHALPFTLDVSGTAQRVEVINPNGPVLRFVSQAEGQGSFGIKGYTSTDIIHMANGQGSGTSRFLAASGDELLGAFTVQLTPTDTPGSLVIEGLTQFLGGTGIFAGATGSARLQGNGRFISETQALVQFLHQGDLVLPEPASSALVAVGLAAASAASSRRRQRVAV